MGLVAVEVNGTICTFGGYGADNQPLPTVECYDPVSDQWRPGTDMPTARGLLGVVPSGDHAYLIGGTRAGRDKLATVERYHPELDTWSRKADLPTPRNALSSVAVGGRIYAVGGWGVDDDDRARDFDTMESYDSRSDRWSPRAPMPAGRSHMATVASDGKIYAIGGWMQSAGSFVALSTVTIYDVESDHWSQAEDMPTPPYLATAAVTGAAIYVVGGWVIGPDGNPRATDLVEVFDPATGLWARDVPLSSPRAGHASAAFKGQILLFGGASSFPSRSAGALLTTIEQYTPSDLESLTPIVAGGERSDPNVPVTSAAEFRDGGAYGQILQVEQPFGNLRTNLVRGDLQRLGLSLGSKLLVRIGSGDFSAILGKDFSDVARGEWVAFAMPDGTIALARNFASAAEACGCIGGESIFVFAD
jgi:hypothetical protein